MFKYKNIVFSLRGILVNSLNMIKGIGISRARYIMDSLGFSRFFKTVYMNHYHHGNLVVLLKSCYLLDVRLQELHIQRLEFFYSYSFIKGFRLFDGLSLKGRTHSNGSTAYRLKPFSEKYNEQILSKQRRYLLYAKTRVKKKKK